MKTQVAILHNEYPTEVRDHVVDKLQHLIKFYDGTLSVRAVLERQHDEHRVELIANVGRGVVPSRTRENPPASQAEPLHPARTTIDEHSR